MQYRRFRHSCSQKISGSSSAAPSDRGSSPAQAYNSKASIVSDWVQGAAELLEPLYECLRKRVLGCDYIRIDETTIPVFATNMASTIEQVFGLFSFDAVDIPEDDPEEEETFARRMRRQTKKKRRTRAEPKQNLYGNRKMI